MLRYSFNEMALAERIDQAVDAVLTQGLRTADIVSAGQSAISTEEMGDAVVKALREQN